MNNGDRKPKFDEVSQKLDLLKTRDIALNQMTYDVKNYITSIYGNLDKYQY